MKNTFVKAERLKSKKTIAHLFSGGRSFAAYPLRLIYISVPLDGVAKSIPVLFSMSVPKKNFKLAVTRNLLRRRIRETYRLRKSAFFSELSESVSEIPQQYALMFLYTGREILSYADIEISMTKILKRFFYDAGLKQSFNAQKPKTSTTDRMPE